MLNNKLLWHYGELSYKFESFLAGQTELLPDWRNIIYSPNFTICALISEFGVCAMELMSYVYVYDYSHEHVHMNIETTQNNYFICFQD